MIDFKIATLQEVEEYYDKYPLREGETVRVNKKLSGSSDYCDVYNAEYSTVTSETTRPRSCISIVTNTGTTARVFSWRFIRYSIPKDILDEDIFI